MYETDEDSQLPANNREDINFLDEAISLTPKPTSMPGVGETLIWKPNNTVRGIPQSGDSQFPIKKRWEGRIAHPRRLIGAMKANLEDLGYQVEANYQDEPGPVRDTSYFQGNVSATQVHKRRNNGLLILGILTLIFIVGYWVLKSSNRLEQSLIKIEFEGESYYVEARQEHTMNIPNEGRLNYSERTGVLSDISIILQAGVFSAIDFDINSNSTQSNDTELIDFTKNVTENITNIWNNSAIT